MMNAGSSASRPKTFVSVELSGDGLERLMKENEEPVEVVQIGPDRYRISVDFGEPFAEEQRDLAAHLLARWYGSTTKT